MSSSGRWQPGQSGNPAGRKPRDAAAGDIGAALIELLAAAHSSQRKQPRTTAEAVAMGLIRRANEGDVSAVRQIRALTEGRSVPQAEQPQPWDENDPDDPRTVLARKLQALAELGHVTLPDDPDAL